MKTEKKKETEAPFPFEKSVVEQIRFIVEHYATEHPDTTTQRKQGQTEAQIAQLLLPFGIELIKAEAKAEGKAEGRKEAQEEFEKQYRLIRQGISTNEVTKIATRKKTKPETTISGLAKFKRGDFILTVKDYMKTAGVRTSVHQLFDALCEALTDGGVKDPIVKISLRDFMSLRGLKDEKSARQQIKEDLSTLSNFRMTFSEKRRNKPTTPYFDLAVIGSHGIENSFIVVAFDPAFIELFKTYNVMNYPSILWRLNAHNFPHAYYFGRKITEHKNLNYGSPNEDIIAITTILNSSPYMPNAENVAGKHYKQLVIDPFEENMNALEDVLTWEYCHSKGTPLTDEELAALYDKGGYHTFVTLLVQVHWKDFPTRPPLPKKRTANKKKQQQPQPDVIAL